MTLYQELQLNQAGAKALIKKAGNRREKQRHIGVYILKVFLTMAFCVAFISAFTALFGPENSIAGVVVLLAVMVFRQADLGIDSKQSFFVLLGIFGILSVGPHIAAVSSPITAFAVDFICIFALTFFGCHNILMSNHATFVLGYLLLSGNDVSGGAYGTRILGLMAGGLLTALIFYRNHYKITYKRRLSDIFREFYLTSSRTKWQLCITLGVALVMLVSRELGLPRPMWAGFAAMSVMQPFAEDLKQRVKHRLPGTIAGGLLFLLLCRVLPEGSYGMLGIAGGICVGFCATYGWQTVFNSFGALAVAAGLYGAGGAVMHRYLANIIGIVLAVVFYSVFEYLSGRMNAAETVSE